LISTPEFREETLEARLFHEFLLLHEGAERQDAFVRITRRFRRLPGPVYWDLLRLLWLNSNVITPASSFWRRAFAKHPDFRIHFMNQPETDFLRSLPATIEVYRGCGVYREGFSWTLSERVAKSYPRKVITEVRALRRKAQILTGVVQKSKIIGFIDARDEKEIVVLPEGVEIVDVQKRNYSAPVSRRPSRLI
jgi:hypothetical protein